MKPIIGITPNYSYDGKKFMIHEDYVAAIKNAGGYPVLIFPQQGLPAFVDGIVLTGGADIDPMLFGEEPLRESGEICPLRDDFELPLCDLALKANLPLLGICRGMQVMNIAAGGGIYQDIVVQTDTSLKHDQQAPRSYATHSIRTERNTLLSSLWEKEKITVNSLHHQAVSVLGKGFLVAASSPDGITEAIEHRDNAFVLGVQWHPESMTTEEQRQLFGAFMEAATEYHLRRRESL